MERHPARRWPLRSGRSSQPCGSASRLKGCSQHLQTGSHFQPRSPFPSGLGRQQLDQQPSARVDRGIVLHEAHIGGILRNAVLSVVDLGPNLSVTGSLATILWLIAIRKENLHVSAWTFLKAGIVVMPPALLLATLAPNCCYCPNAFSKNFTIRCRASKPCQGSELGFPKIPFASGP